MSDSLRTSGAGLAIGLGFVSIGVVIAISTSAMQIPPTYAKVGPEVVPYLVAGVLAGLGTVIAWQAYFGSPSALRPEAGIAAEWRPVMMISAGFGAFIALLKAGGFIAAAMLLFLATTRAFGSRRYVRDAMIGALLTVAVYLLFSRVLKLPLPKGLLDGLM
jgi:putative tricarboxylic transport membrane protein